MAITTALVRSLAVAMVAFAGGCTLSLELDQLSAGDDCQGPKCNEPAYTGPGSVGSGIVVPYDQLPRREIVGGFVQDGFLFVAVRVQPVPTSDDQGAILSVDLTTGNRELVSGYIVDRSGLEHERGGGPRLGNLHGIRVRADGRWVVHLWNRLGFVGDRVSIDPQSGGRSPEPGVGMECPTAPGVDITFPVPDRSVLDRQGEVYVSVDGTSVKGVGRLGHDTCTLFDLTPLAGPFVLGPFQDAIGFADASTGQIGWLDTASSALASAPGTSAELGAVLGAAWSQDQAWLFRAPNVLERVATDTGQRVSFPIEGLGPPQDTPDLWPHPDGRRVLLELDGRILLVDPEQGKSSVLSY